MVNYKLTRTQRQDKSGVEKGDYILPIRNN